MGIAYLTKVYFYENYIDAISVNTDIDNVIQGITIPYSKIDEVLHQDIKRNFTIDNGSIKSESDYIKVDTPMRNTFTEVIYRPLCYDVCYFSLIMELVNDNALYLGKLNTYNTDILPVDFDKIVVDVSKDYIGIPSMLGTDDYETLVSNNSGLLSRELNFSFAVPKSKNKAFYKMNFSKIDERIFSDVEYIIYRLDYTIPMTAIEHNSNLSGFIVDRYQTYAKLNSLYENYSTLARLLMPHIGDSKNEYHTKCLPVISLQRDGGIPKGYEKSEVLDILQNIVKSKEVSNNVFAIQAEKMYKRSRSTFDFYLKVLELTSTLNKKLIKEKLDLMHFKTALSYSGTNDEFKFDVPELGNKVYIIRSDSGVI